MKSEIKQISLVLVLISLSLMSGCNSIHPLELAEDITKGSFKVITDSSDFLFGLIAPSKKAEILWADVYEDGNDVLVKGVLRRIGHSNAPFNVHVDVAIFSSDGKLLYEHSTPEVGVPRKVVGKGTGWKRFNATFPGQIPEDSSIRVVCHAKPHNDEI